MLPAVNLTVLINKQKLSATFKHSKNATDSYYPAVEVDEVDVVVDVGAVAVEANFVDVETVDVDVST